MDSHDLTNDIAIIGMACRYPGAPSLHAFWELVRDGKEGISHFSEEELLAAGVDPAELADPHYVRSYGRLEGIERFDAAFFGYTPREAQLTDPQHRLFLETCWHAFEHAGCDPARVTGQVGVFGGAGQNAYRLQNLITNPGLLRDAGGVQTTLGNDPDFLTTRVSYKLGLRGPSLDVQTACSTSMVAAHLAVQSLLSGESDMALAGGVSIVTTHKQGYRYIPGGTVSPDGHTRTFDARAQGMVGGDGVGVLLLKRLEDALADRDTVYALIKGTAVNNDGARKLGFTAPSIGGQARVIAEAQAVAGVRPEEIDTIELHGTATPLGDAVEYAALRQVFAGSGIPPGRIAVGSCKTNIGHTNTASGAAGLIKTALALKDRLIPPSLFFESPNPEFNLEQSPFAVNRELREWPSDGRPRRAGVSSFGMGGTNAHAVLEEAPLLEPAPAGRPYEIVTLSAKTAAALDTAAANLSAELAALDAEPAAQAPPPLADAAYTLHLGRRAMPHRRFTVAPSAQEAGRALRANEPGHVFSGTTLAQPPPLAFLFPGQGAQYISMARGLFDTEPEFRAALTRVAELFAPHLDIPLLDVVYPDNNQGATLQDTKYTQPALFAVEYALAELLRGWGLQPAALLGHSIGEFTAACLAGVFAIEDACRVVAERGRLMSACEPGAMLAVTLREDEILGYLDAGISLAAVNEPAGCVVSGPFEALDRLESRLTVENIAVRRLHTSHAFHSAMMEPAMDPFRALLESIPLHAPQIPVISNRSGRPLTPEQATDAGYWVAQMRETVRFADGLAALFADPELALLEVGPGTTLSALSRRHPAASNGRRIIPVSRHPKDPADDAEKMAGALGLLWLAGVEIDWEAYHAGERRTRVPLPGYPFDRKRHWIEPGDPAPADPQPAKNPDIAAWFYLPSWKRTAFPAAAHFSHPQNWLVFADRGGLGARIADRLRAEGQTVRVAHTGDVYAQSSGAFTLRPGEEADTEALLAALRSAGERPDTILHLWGVDPAGEDPDEALRAGFYSLLFLAKALGRRAAGDVRLAVVSTGMQDVLGGEPVEPIKAAAIGPARVIPAEFKGFSCLAIDLAETESADLPERLLAELSAPAPKHTETLIAYRGKSRWVRTFEPVHLQAPVKEPAVLRAQGVYLITGGLGGIGMALAEYLAGAVQARLILTGRRAGGSDDPRVKQLEASGAQVFVAQADVADPEAMRAALEEGERRFGALNGVVHAAGVAGGGAIALKEAETAAQVMRAKIQGTLVLEHLLQGREPDFFVLCSSLASSLGGYGQIDYAAANAFLDAYGESRAGQSPRTISIGWDTWREAGMAVDTPVPRELEAGRDASLALGISHQEGAEVFTRALAAGAPHLMISTIDFQRRYEAQTHVAQAGGVALEDGERVPTGEEAAREALTAGYVAPQTPLEKQVARIWQLNFGIDRIGIDDDFFQLGGHSLLATQILNQLHKEFETLELSMRALFEKPTIAGLVAIIEASSGAQAQGAEPVLTRFEKSETAEARLAFLQDYLQAALEGEPGAVSRDAALIWLLKRDFNLRVYPREIQAHPSAAELAAFIHAQLAGGGKTAQSTALEFPDSTRRAPEPLSDPLPTMGFILSAPRSGSTLLRLMLNAHPALFAPPELALMAFDDLAEWRANQKATFAVDGLTQALQGLGRPDAAARVSAWAERGKSIPDVYRELLAAAAGRTLVDKTPGYAMQPETLARAEAWFNGPWYIHLVRHPLPAIDSFARNRMHVVLGMDSADPYALGEAIWARWNRNIRAFLDSVNPDRQITLRYEDLVKAPENAMQQVCRFLDLPYESGMVSPYRQEQMLAGPGDPDILLHDKIDAALADAWQTVDLPVELSEDSRELADEYGYTIPENGGRPLDSAGIDAMSDAEVEAMLQQLLDEESGA